MARLRAIWARKAGSFAGSRSSPAAELLEAGAEGVLEEVLGLGAAVGVAVEDDRHAPAVELDHPLLGAPVPRLDARDQVLRPLGGYLVLARRSVPADCPRQTAGGF